MVARKIVMTQLSQPENKDDAPRVLSIKSSTYQKWNNLREELELEVSYTEIKDNQRLRNKHVRKLPTFASDLILRDRICIVVSIG